MLGAYCRAPPASLYLRDRRASTAICPHLPQHFSARPPLSRGPVEHRLGDRELGETCFFAGLTPLHALLATQHNPVQKAANHHLLPFSNPHHQPLVSCTQIDGPPPNLSYTVFMDPFSPAGTDQFVAWVKQKGWPYQLWPDLSWYSSWEPFETIVAPSSVFQRRSSPNSGRPRCGR